MYCLGIYKCDKPITFEGVNNRFKIQDVCYFLGGGRDRIRGKDKTEASY